jgi:hypothetical protein
MSKIYYTANWKTFVTKLIVPVTVPPTSCATAFAMNPVLECLLELEELSSALAT